MLLSAFVWDIDPTLIHWGELQIRYYGVIFSATLLVGYMLWRWQVLRGGYSRVLADNFLFLGVAAVVVGARLGHCFFYEPNVYLRHPELIPQVWHGGLSSHGALIGLVLALWIFSRWQRLRTLEVMDRFTFAAAAGAVGIRLANFMNSEIVGRVTDVPWAVIFKQAEHPYDAAPRHPAQLYEGLLAAMVLVVLLVVDRRAGKEKRPLGLLTGMMLTLYFGGRVFTEFFKEFQTTWERYVTAGQLLSLPPFLVGAVLLWWALTRRQPGGKLPDPVVVQPAPNHLKKRKRRR